MTSPRDDANVSIFGFLAATGVFAVSFATIVDVSYERKGAAVETPSADLEVAAHRLAELLLASPGDGWYLDGPACDLTGRIETGFTPDSVRRLGLAIESCETAAAFAGVSNLSYAKVLKLHEASYEVDLLNDALDYKEARAGLDMDDLGLNFHIRTWPVLPDVSRILETGVKDPYLRPLYVGDYEIMSGGESQDPRVQHAAGWADAAEYADFYVNVTNNGTTTTGFSVLFKVQTQQELVTEMHTPAVAPGASSNVTLRLNKTAGWTWDSQGGETDAFEYVIRDPSRTVGEGEVSRAGLDMGAASTRRQYLVEADRLQAILEDGTAEVKIAYDAADGEGKTNVQVTGWSIEIRDALSGTLHASATNLQNNGGTKEFELTQLGAYEARLLDSSGAVRQIDVFSVSAAEFDPFMPEGYAGDWEPQAPVSNETHYIDALVEYFERGVYDAKYTHGDAPYVPGGDIVPDDNQALASFLSDRLRDDDGNATLAEYNILFVGTNVDHNTLTSAAIKYAIRDWVFAGGSLVVFGSEEQAVQWMMPMFNVALDGAGNGLGVPDQTHPLLRVPNRLDYETYDTRDRAWHFNQEDARDKFTHVVLDGEDDVLAISDPGSFGKGRILLTSWQPYDVLTSGEPSSCDPGSLGATCPGMQLLLNFMTIAYHGLYLDYGPTVPDTSPQGVTMRIAVVFHPELGQLVELHLLVFVFA